MLDFQRGETILRRLLVFPILILAPFLSGQALATTLPGCLSTDSGTFQWTLPTTPESPNWPLSSVGSYEQETPQGTFNTVAIPFSATFWRRSSCASQLIVTFDVPSTLYANTEGFYLVQNGVGHQLVEYWVSDPANFDYISESFTYPPVGTTSGLVPLFSFDNVDLSQAMTIQYNPPTQLGALSIVTIQIPAASSASTPPSFAIGNGITGNWFDPSESGHGFGIEVLPGNTMLAEWYVYGLQGGRDWILATGPITGNTAVLTAYQAGGAGGRFPPNFNPAEIENQAWGTITFTFTDCNNGTASWQPTVAGYTAGSIPITRLTMPAGLSCP